MKGLHVEVDNQVFKELFLASPVASYVCDNDGYVIAFNDAAVSLWGRQPELKKDRWSGALACYYPDGRPMALEDSPMAIVLSGQPGAVREELVIERPDGTRRNVLVFPHPIRNDSGHREKCPSRTADRHDGVSGFLTAADRR